MNPQQRKRLTKTFLDTNIKNVYMNKLQNSKLKEIKK